MFVNALVEAADDPTAFTGETDSLRSVSLIVSPRDSPDFESLIPRFKPNEWADVVIRSRSPRVQEFFLTNFGHVLEDEARLRKVAELIKSKDFEVRLQTARYLLRSLKVPEMEPQAQVIDGEQQWVNMPEIEAYWIKRFKLDG